MSAIVTSLLLYYPQGGLDARVLGADATATTYLLNCDSTLEDCGTFNNSVTLGPWASKTLPAGAASTGEFDYYASMDYEEPWKFSIHCEMSRSVAQKCTTINIGGNDDGKPTATFTASNDLVDLDLATLEYVSVTITAGQELLGATHTASQKTSATTQDAEIAQASTSGATDVASTEDSTSVATPDSTSGSASRIVSVIMAASMAGIVTMMVL